MVEYAPDLLVRTESGGLIPAHSQVLGRYSGRVASAMAHADQLERDPQTGLPVVRWTWPVGTQVPVALLALPAQYGAAVPVADAIRAVLALAYLHYMAQDGVALSDRIGSVVGASAYNVAVLAVLARDLDWSELHQALDGLLAGMPSQLLGPETARFARQIGLQRTLRAVIRAGVKTDPYQLEVAGGVTLAEISDAVTGSDVGGLRFVDLIRVAAQIDLPPDQITFKALYDPLFYIMIEGSDRLRYLLHWTRRLHLFGADFWQGWFSRVGYTIVERLKVRSSRGLDDQLDGVRMLQELRALVTDLVKNELVCVPNPDPRFAHWDFTQTVRIEPPPSPSKFWLPFRRTN